jgi:hypothetical protein
MQGVEASAFFQTVFSLFPRKFRPVRMASPAFIKIEKY